MHLISDMLCVTVQLFCGSVFLVLLFRYTFSLLVPRAPLRAPPTSSLLVVLQRNGNLGAQEPVNKTGFTCTCSITPSPPPPLLHLPLSFLLPLSPSPSPLLRRVLHPPGILCIPGSTAGLPECACGSESLLHTSDDEHVLRLAQDSQYLRSLWEVSER